MVNRNHFCDYAHRIPPERVQVVSADGDLELQSLTFLGGQGMMVIGPSWDWEGVMKWKGCSMGATLLGLNWVGQFTILGTGSRDGNEASSPVFL